MENVAGVQYGMSYKAYCALTVFSAVCSDDTVRVIEHSDVHFYVAKSSAQITFSNMPNPVRCLTTNTPVFSLIKILWAGLL